MTDDKIFICHYCRQPYESRELATKCYIGHDLVFVELSKSDLNRLAQFIMLKDEKLITKTLYNSIFKYFKDVYS